MSRRRRKRSSSAGRSQPSSRRPRYRQLKPRPGHSGKEIAEHQRGRIHAATIELVDEVGYGALTVTGIARAAGISNHTFYENFKGKEDCFLATYDLIVRHTAREVLVARRRESGRRAKLRAEFLAFAREVAESPKAARLALVEAYAARPAQARVRHTIGLFGALVADSFAGGRAGFDLPPLVAIGIVAGATRVARVRLLAGEERRLPSDVDELMRWALSLSNEAAKAVCAGSGQVIPAPSTPPVKTDGRRITGAGNQPLGDEQAMIVSAVAQLVGGEGYAALTVPRIRAAAGIPRRRFDKHFEDVTDCFLATLELLVGRVLAEVRTAYLSAEAWPNGIHRALATVCREVADDPVLVRLAFFELFGPGPDAVRWRVRLVGVLSSALRGSAPVERRPTELAAEASTGAAWGVLHHYATTGRARELPQIAGTLSYLVLAPAIGAEAAVEVIQAEQAAAGAERRAANRRRGV